MSAGGRDGFRQKKMHRLRRAQTAKTVLTNTIGRFLLVGLTSPLGVSNLRHVATRSKNVAHLGGTVICRTPLLIMIIILIVNSFFSL